MQLYRGLPVITNKLAPSQQQNVPHHLLDMIDLDQQPWTVREFVKAADEKIAEVRARGRVPVVVGGTGYYARALVWGDGMLREEGAGVEGVFGAQEMAEEKEGEGRSEESIKRWPVLDGTSEEIYKELERLDPEMAARWHPRDRRRVQRSLEICLRTGRKVSEIYREQVAEKGMGKGDSGEHALSDEEEGDVGQVNGQLRYDPLVLWLGAEDAALKERLNARVGDMVKDGLFEEALQLQQQEKDFRAQGVDIDKSKGIWVSIGYKEMEAWAEQQLADPCALEEAKQSPLAKECLEAVKAGTRRYAKRQERYIRITFANTLTRAGLSNRLMLLDGSNLGRFYTHLVPQAEDLVTAFLSGRDLPEPPSLSQLARETFEKIQNGSPDSGQRMQHYCDVCDRTLMSDKEWKTHITGNGHKKVLQGRRKHQQKLEYLARAAQLGDAASDGRPVVDVPS